MKRIRTTIPNLVEGNPQDLLLSSRLHSDALGFFCGRTAAIGLSGKRIVVSDVEDFLAKNPDPETRLRGALSSVTYFHEMRHLHDVFGTIGGMGVFFSWLSLARQFVRVLGEIHRAGKKWRLPWNLWVQRKDCPSAVREFMHRAQVVGCALRAYTGVSCDVLADSKDLRPTDVYAWRQMKSFELRYPVYNYRWKLGDEVKSTAVPVGLNCLLEGSAHAMQRALLSIWPQEIQDAVHSRLYANARIRPGDAEVVSQGVAGLLIKRRTVKNRTHSDDVDVEPAPYNITDLLITRFLERQEGKYYSRGSLLALTDYALMHGHILLKSKRGASHDQTQIFGSICHPGEVFVNKLESLSRAEIEKNTHPLAEPKDIVSGLLDTMAKSPVPAQIMDVVKGVGALSLGTCVELMDSIVRHDIIVPLFRLRLKYGDRVFREEVEYVKRLEEFPKPIVTTVFDSASRPVAATQVVARVWSIYVLLIDVMAQIVAGQSNIDCARKISPLLKKLSLANAGDCDELLKAGCGYWRRERTTPLPECIFAQVMNVCGFTN